MGSTGGQRIPQVRYTLAGPYGSAFSVSAEQPTVSVETPGGLFANDSNTGGLPGGPGTGHDLRDLQWRPLHRCGNRGQWQHRQGHRAQSHRRLLLGAALGARRLRRCARSDAVQRRPFHLPGLPRLWRPFQRRRQAWLVRVGQGRFPVQLYRGRRYRRTIRAAVGPTLRGWRPTSLSRPRARHPVPGCTGGMAASNVLFNPVFAYSTNGGYQHWWAPNLRSTIAAGIAHQDLNSQLIGPSPIQHIYQGAVERLCQSGVEPGRVHHRRRPVQLWHPRRRRQRQGPCAGYLRQVPRSLLGGGRCSN